MRFGPFIMQKISFNIFRQANALKQDVSGNAAIEFAILAPIFTLILAVSFDIGALVFARFQLEAAISNNASYAIVHSDQIDGKSDNQLAKSLALMIAGQFTSGDASASVVVNDGVQASYDGAIVKIDGTPGPTGACYCPKGMASSFNWGSQQTCGSSCPDGAVPASTS
ncbi:TadE/TadG family type IV pilus assembly protein [Rhizobium sp. BR 362]|uniref:TadE/TadG family type IV pilus assembly protein n=1 Tax=Rhizobium sp. BR 362 TaxID=3040670 RepID=UPI002F41B312